MASYMDKINFNGIHHNGAKENLHKEATKTLSYHNNIVVSRLINFKVIIVYGAR
jgi:hypothetical protein